MTVAFRNVDVADDLPLSAWPYEALVAMLERGTVSDWVVLTREIATDPWGPVSRQVEDYLSYERPPGLGRLMELAIARARRQAESQERAAVGAEVAELVAASGLSLAELASRIGTSGSRLSTYRSGQVMPSAAVMVRLRKTVARLHP